MTAEYKVDGAIAVITLNNPPVNGLGLDCAAEGLRQPWRMTPSRPSSLPGAGKAFSGGARYHRVRRRCSL
jgi:3-hydroxyacyl-CoA dehydrogenase